MKGKKQMKRFKKYINLTLGLLMVGAIGGMEQCAMGLKDGVLLILVLWLVILCLNPEMLLKTKNEAQKGEGKYVL